MRSLNTLGLGLLGGGLLMAVAMVVDVVRGAHADTALFEVAASFAAVGGVLVFLTRARLPELMRSQGEPQEVLATVTAVDKRALQDPGEAPVYVVHFRYEDERRVQRTGSAAMPQAEAFRYREGDSAIVRYVPGDAASAVWVGGSPPRHEDLPAAPSPARDSAAPSFAALARRSGELKDAFAGSVFSVLFAVPTVALWLAWRHGVPWMQIVVSAAFLLLCGQVARKARAGLRHMAEARELLERGSLANAVVTRVIELPRYMGRTTSISWSAWAVEYVFHDAAGRKRHGTSEASGAQAKHLRTGDRIIVHYDAAAPNRSAWFGTRA